MHVANVRGKAHAGGNVYLIHAECEEETATKCVFLRNIKWY